MLAAAAAVLALVLSVGRAHWTVAALVFVNLAAVADGSLMGNVSLADAAQPLRPIVLGAAAVQATRLLLRGDARGAFAVNAPMIPLLIVVAASIAWSAHLPVEAENSIAFATLLLSVGVIAAFAARDARVRQKVLFAVALAYGAMGFLNVLLLPVVDTAFRATASGPRFQGLLENPNSVGLLASAGIPLLIAAGLATQSSLFQRRLWLTGAAVLGVQLLLSVSRSGLAGAIAAVLVLFVILTRGRATLRAMAMVVLASVITVLLLAGVAARVAEALRLGTAARAGGRVEVLPQARELIAQRPLLGHGYGSERGLFESLGDIPGFTGSYAGNVFVDLMLEMGVLGLLTFGIACAVPLVHFSTFWRMRRAVQVEFAIWPAVAIGGLTNAQGESYLVRPGGIGAPVIWFALAICTALGLEARRRRQTEQTLRP